MTTGTPDILNAFRQEAKRLFQNVIAETAPRFLNYRKKCLPGNSWKKMPALSRM
jgi:hypothetical protein